MAVWMVRSGRRGMIEDIALSKNLVGVGWGDLPDLKSCTTRKEIFELSKKAYPDWSTGKLSNSTGQLFGFCCAMKRGDLVIMPLGTRSGFAVGEVTGDYEYRTDLGQHVRHVRSVKWIQTDLPRPALKQDLLYTLGAIMTVCRVERNNAEQRIHAVLETGSDPGYEGAVDEPEEGGEVEEGPDIEQASRDQILSYIEEHFQGHDLAHLVDDILKAEGYITEFSTPGPDGGVDILAGRGALGFDPPRLAVQVKSSKSPADVTILRTLQGTMTNFKAEQGLLVCWGGFNKVVIKEARQAYFSVRLWDAGNVIDALLRNYEHLSEDRKADLPLKRIWALVLEE